MAGPASTAALDAVTLSAAVTYAAKDNLIDAYVVKTDVGWEDRISRQDAELPAPKRGDWLSFTQFQGRLGLINYLCAPNPKNLHNPERSLAPSHRAAAALRRRVPLSRQRTRGRCAAFS
ncbi:MAG: hypothetical protein P4L98_08370 [Ancalomicrobiaceae bacterium]|nr:hypothetical protein [Ancalomicrobiaceae bacterium]